MEKIQKLDKSQIRNLFEKACGSERFQKEYKKVHRDYAYCGSFSDEFGDYAIDVKVYKDKVKFMVYYEFEFLQQFSVSRNKIDKKLGCYIKQDKPKGLVFTDEILQDNCIIIFDSLEKINQELSQNRLALYLRYKKINDIDGLIQAYNDRDSGKLLRIEFGQRTYKPNILFHRQRVTNDCIILVWCDNVVIIRISYIKKVFDGYNVLIHSAHYKHIVKSKFTNKLRLKDAKTNAFQDVDNTLIEKYIRPSKVMDIFDLKNKEDIDSFLSS